MFRRDFSIVGIYFTIFVLKIDKQLIELTATTIWLSTTSNSFNTDNVLACHRIESNHNSVTLDNYIFVFVLFCVSIFNATTHILHAIHFKIQTEFQNTLDTKTTAYLYIVWWNKDDSLELRNRFFFIFSIDCWNVRVNRQRRGI